MESSNEQYEEYYGGEDQYDMTESLYPHQPPGHATSDQRIPIVDQQQQGHTPHGVMSRGSRAVQEQRSASGLAQLPMHQSTVGYNNTIPASSRDRQGYAQPLQGYGGHTSTQLGFGVEQQWVATPVTNAQPAAATSAPASYAQGPSAASGAATNPVPAGLTYEEVMQESEDSAQSTQAASTAYTIACPYCGKILNGPHARSNLKRHYKSRACPGLPQRSAIVCMECGKDFARSDGLAVHMRRTHNMRG